MPISRGSRASGKAGRRNWPGRTNGFRPRKPRSQHFSRARLGGLPPLSAQSQSRTRGILDLPARAKMSLKIRLKPHVVRTGAYLAARPGLKAKVLLALRRFPRLHARLARAARPVSTMSGTRAASEQAASLDADHLTPSARRVYQDLLDARSPCKLEEWRKVVTSGDPVRSSDADPSRPAGMPVGQPVSGYRPVHRCPSPRPSPEMQASTKSGCCLAICSPTR